MQALSHVGHNGRAQFTTGTPEMSTRARAVDENRPYLPETRPRTDRIMNAEFGGGAPLRPQEEGHVERGAPPCFDHRDCSSGPAPRCGPNRPAPARGGRGRIGMRDRRRGADVRHAPGGRRGVERRPDGSHDGLLRRGHDHDAERVGARRFRRDLSAHRVERRIEDADQRGGAGRPAGSVHPRDDHGQRRSAGSTAAAGNVLTWTIASLAGGRGRPP